jgi:hypothetical protein
MRTADDDLKAAAVIRQAVMRLIADRGVAAAIVRDARDLAKQARRNPV